MKQIDWIRLVTIALLVVTSSGCALLMPKQTIDPIPPDTGINLVVEADGFKTPNAVGPLIIPPFAVGGLAVGTAGGAVMGVGCGFPGLIICVPIAAVGGAVAGVAKGSEMASDIALPHKKAKQLESVIDRYVESEDTAGYTRHAFISEQSGRWYVTDSPAEVVVTLQITDLDLDQESGDTARLTVVSILTAEYGPESARVIRRTTIRRASPLEHVDYWLDNDGANLDRFLDDALRESAQRAVSYLSDPGPVSPTVLQSVAGEAL